MGLLSPPHKTATIGFAFLEYNNLLVALASHTSRAILQLSDCCIP